MKKQTWKSLLALSLSGAMLLSAAGCGNSGGTASGDTGSKASGAAEAESAAESAGGETKPVEKTEVNVIIQGDSYQAYLDYLAEKLEGDDSFPYTLNVECIALSELDEKINLAHASGNDYDVILVNNSSVIQFTNVGVLDPMDEFVKAHPDITENYGASLLEVGQAGGVQYALPVAPGSRILAYNKKLLADAGYSAPKTQEEFLEISKAVAHDGVYAFARQMNTALAPAYIEGCFWMANGASIAKEIDGKIVATCNEQAMIDNVKWWQEMTAYMPDDINMTDSQVRALFDQGKLAFYVFGAWEFGLLENMKYGEDYELMLTPGTEGYGSTLGGWYIGVGSNAANKEGAYAFIEQFIRPENIVNLNDGLPADNRCYEMEPYNTEEYNMFMESLEYTTVPFPITADFNEINEVFFEYFNECLIGKADAADTMEICNEKIQALFDAE